MMFLLPLQTYLPFSSEEEEEDNNFFNDLVRTESDSDHSADEDCTVAKQLQNG